MRTNNRENGWMNRERNVYTERFSGGIFACLIHMQLFSPMWLVVQRALNPIDHTCNFLLCVPACFSGNTCLAAYSRGICGWFSDVIWARKVEMVVCRFYFSILPRYKFYSWDKFRVGRVSQSHVTVVMNLMALNSIWTLSSLAIYLTWEIVSLCTDDV